MFDNKCDKVMKSKKIKELIDMLIRLYGEHLSDIEKDGLRIRLDNITDHVEWEATFRMRVQAVEVLRNVCPNNDCGRCKIKGVLCSDTMCRLVKRFEAELNKK